MAHGEKTITINKQVNKVFQFILDGENNKLWRRSVTDIKRITTKPDKVGAAFKQGARGPCGRRIDADYEITRLDTNKSISFKVTKGPARPTGVYTFEKDGSGTKLTFVLDYQPRGFAKLMDPMVNRTMQAEVASLLELKTCLEAQK